MTRTYVLNYGSSATCSAGDAAYSTRQSAFAAFRRRLKRHPDVSSLTIHVHQRQNDAAPWNVKPVRDLENIIDARK